MCAVLVETSRQANTPPTMSQTQTWFAQVIRAQSRRYLKSFKAVRRNASTAHVHALRTATRRVLAALSLTAAIYPQGSHRKLEAALQGPFKSCGHLRDLQLMKRVVSSFRRRHPEVAQLLAYIGRLLEKQQQRLTRRLARAHPRRMEHTLQKLAARIEAGSKASVRGRSTTQLLTRELERSRRSMETLRRHATASNADSLHRARLAFKAHRYQLELVKPLLAPFPASHIRQLRQFQTALGAITDRTTLLRAIDDFREKNPRSAGDILPYRERIERERRRLIGRYLPEIARSGRATSKASSR